MRTILNSRFLRRGLCAALFAAITFGGFLRADAPQNEVLTDPAALLEKAVIDEAVFLATSSVAEFASTDPEGFTAVLRQTFGSRLSPVAEQQFLADAASRQLPLPERFVIVPNMILEGASAAYMSKDGGVILLAAEFSDSAPLLATLILHEWGHHLDTQLGRGDSAHDEGELFYRGINRGGPVPAIALHVTNVGADDRAVIEFEGETVEVECWGNPIKAIGNLVRKAGNAVVNVAKAAVNTVVNVAKKTVSFVGNTVKAAGNAVKGAAMGIASGVAHLSGNTSLGDSLAKGARDSFGSSFKGIKGAGSDAIGAVADAGNLINKTSAELDKVAPGLGTIGSIAVGFTPAGPAVALAKGVADVKNVIDNGGSTGAIFGAVGFAALDFAGSKLGRFTGGMSAAKAGAAGAKGLSTVAKVGGKVSRFPKLTKAWGGIKKGVGKLKKGVDAKQAATLKSWKHTKATANEIAKGGKFLAKHPTLAKGLDIVQKVNKYTQPKAFIPGRDRNTSGVLLGTGGNQWQQFEKKGGDFFGGGDSGSGGGSLEDKNRSTGTVKSFNAAKGFGFITPDDGGKDLFVHHSEIQSSGHASLDKGQKVDFEISEGKKGPSATDVRALLTNTDSGTKTGQALASLSGRVTGTDEKGNYLGIVPKAHIQVSSDDPTSVTLNIYANETGYYGVSGLKPGRYTFYVMADGYHGHSSGKTLVIPANPTGGYVVGFILTQTDFFSTIKSGTMTGHAWEEKNGKRTPMAGVKVVAKLESGGYGYREGTTDKNGNYSFNVAPGMWKASATPRGWDSIERKVYPGIVTVKEKVSTTADFLFTEQDKKAPPTAGKVHLLVSVPAVTKGMIPESRFVNAATGKSYPAKVIQAPKTNPPRPDTERWYQADPVEPLPVGRYHAEGDYNGGNVKSEVKTVSAGQTTWFDVAYTMMKSPTPADDPATNPIPPKTPKDPVMPDVPVVPVVKPKLDIYTSYGGSGVYNVSVTLAMKIPGTGGGRPFTWKTNDEGRVSGTIEDGAGTYSVVASVEGCREYRSEVVVNPTNPTLSIELIPIPRVEITVMSSAGIPLPGVDIRLVDKTRGKSLNEAAQKMSDDYGGGVIYLKDGYGSYALVASLDGYLPAGEELSLIDDPANPGSLLFEQYVTLYKSGENRPVNLTGTLVELSPGHDKAYKDGKKIPNAQIAFQPSEGMTLPEILTTPLRTGTKGEIAAKKIPEGTYIVSISAEGYAAYTGPLKVTFGMEPVLLSLKPRNTARDNWIKMILTEGWGDLLKSRQFHQSGTQEDASDSNVDYALSLSSLKANNKENAIPAFALAVGKVSKEKWWDRAVEGHIWSLMHHQDVGTAVSEIRRLVSSEYSNRAESDESRETAFMFGVAVGVMKGPWMVDSASQLYNQLDAEVMAALKRTHLTSYEAGKNSVSAKYTQLSEAEAKAKKDLMDAATADRDRKLADLRKQLEKLQVDQNGKVREVNEKNQAYTDYCTKAGTLIDGHNARLAQILTDATALHAEITQLQSAPDTGMQEQANRKIQELQNGLESNIAAQNAEVNKFTNYHNDTEGMMANHVNRMNAINAELEQMVQQFANTPATMQGEMAGASMDDLERVEGQLSDVIGQADNLTDAINVKEQDRNTFVAKADAELQQILNRQNGIQQEVNAYNEMSPYCVECREFSEQPEYCPECNEHRAGIQAEIERLQIEFNQKSTEFQNLQNLMAGIDQDYNTDVANYNADIQNNTAQDAQLRAEYNRLADLLNNPPPQTANPAMTNLQNRDAALRAEYEDNNQAWTNLDAGYRQEQSNHQTMLNQLKQTEANLRNQLANSEVPDPVADPRIAQKTTHYNQLLAEDKAERDKVAKVQDDYRIEGERYQQEFARMTDAATTLKNQIDDVNAQMGNLPASGTIPGGEGEAVNSATLAFNTYKDYPIEQRRQELLNWVSRSSDIALPAVLK